MLWRALGHIENGFYIDIGAQHPVQDSVSYAFYVRGWRGIHVEPVKQYADLLRVHRPDEQIVEAVIGQSGGLITLHEVANSGLSTISEEIAASHREANFQVRKVKVPSITLDSLFEQAEDRNVHWLKMDVEGAEKQIFEGWKKSPVRPWIIVVESTYPNSQRDISSEWEGLVLAKGYDLAYRDGLNRFYIDQARPELAEKLNFPPNLWDDFQLSDHSWGTVHVRAQLAGEVNAAAAALSDIEGKLGVEKASLLALTDECNDLRDKLDEVQSDSASARAELETARSSEIRLGQILESKNKAIQEIYKEIERRHQIALTAAENMRIMEGRWFWKLARSFRLQSSNLRSNELFHLIQPLDATWVRFPSATAIPGLTVYELMGLNGEAFVRQAYHAIFDRRADDRGMQFHLARLAVGYPQAAILHDFVVSREGRGGHPEFDGLSDEDFIEALYLRYLGRGADPQGKRRHLKVLKKRGRGWLQRDLRYSQEACVRNGESPVFNEGLKWLVREERRARHWWNRLLHGDRAAQNVRRIDAMMERGVMHAEPYLFTSPSSIEEKALAGTSAPAHPDYERVASHMERGGHYGRFSDLDASSANLDDFMSGAYAPESDDKGKGRWIGKTGRIYLNISGVNLHIVASGKFGDRTIGIRLDDCLVSKKIFSSNKEELIINVADWIGKDVAIHIECLSGSADSTKIGHDKRELCLFLYGIYCQ